VAHDQIRISREDLYEKVWTLPLRKLAPEFGLSDVGLAKICKRHSIPLPGLGYWTRVQFGKHPKRGTLPELEKTASSHTEIVIKPTPASGILKDLSGKIKAEAIRIQISDTDEVSHPLAIRTHKLLLHATKNEHGLLTPKSGAVSHIYVSDVALKRALRILSGLLRTLEEHNFTVKWGTDSNSSRLSIVALDEDLGLVISEKIDAVPHTLTQQELAQKKRGQWVWPPKWDYRSTGNLRLSIEGAPQGIRHSWGDGAVQRVEDCLGKFIASLPIVAEARKREREEHQQREQERKERATLEQERRERLEEYERRAKVLTKLAGKWKEARLMRDFATAFAKASSELCRTAAGKREAELFFIAAMDYAESVDPFSCPANVITEFRNFGKTHFF